MTMWRVLVNPAAGRRAVALPVLEEALDRAGVTSHVEVVTTSGRMRSLAQAAARAGDALAVVGGDGTVSTVVDAIMAAGPTEPALPLGVLPAGTGCDLLRTFGRGTDLLEAAVRLRRGEPYAVDVGVLDGEWGRRHFVNVAQAGVGAAAVESAQRLPRGLGPARYPAGFATRLPGFPRTAVRVVAEGWTVGETPALAAILANGQFFGGGWNIAPKAMLMDGELDVQIIDANKWAAPALVPKLMRGLHLREPGVRRKPLAGLRLETDIAWPVEADGDLVGMTPVDVGVLPAAITLQI